MKERSSFEFMPIVFQHLVSTSLFKAVTVNLKVVFKIQHVLCHGLRSPTRYSDNQKKCEEAGSLPPESWDI